MNEVKLPKDELVRLVQSAKLRNAFPPSVLLPEQERSGSPSRLFALPVIVWVPEVRDSPMVCPMATCKCTPQVKGYMCRVVDDMEHRTLLVFCKYMCLTRRTVFNTVLDTYMSAQPPEVRLHFPYIMTHKYGISHRLMELVHAGITSRHGLKSSLEGVERQRQNRYMKLVSLFGERLRREREQNPLFIAPTPLSLEQFCRQHRVSDQDTLTKLWLSWSDLYSALSEMVMNEAEVKKVVRIDHSRKFSRLLKQCGDVIEGVETQAGVSKKKKKDAANFQLLLLAQNECGQIVARALTASENHTETEAVLREPILPRVEATKEKLVLVCDNATATRGLSKKVFGDRVATKQDPFHVIQRFTDKVRPGNERKRISKDLSASLYDARRQLREAADMGARFQVTVDSVADKDLACTREEWERTVSSNLIQIQRGDLSIANNFYSENGRKSKVVSTSQLEGIHSQLKRALSNPVSIGVGLRVLDIFILEHNLKVGGRWGRNPTIEAVDFLQLCRSALLCNGVVAESEAYEFALRVLSKPLQEPRYRLTSAWDFPFQQWLRVYSTTQPSSEALQFGALPKPKYSIAEMMFRTATSVKTKDVSQRKLLDSLNITGGDIEASGSLTTNEMQLVKQIRREMAAFKVHGDFKMDDELDWTSCAMACTILYNLAVSWNKNPDLALSRRSYVVLRKYIPVVDEFLESNAKGLGKEKRKVPFFAFVSPRLHDDDQSSLEKDVQRDLFSALKTTREVAHRKRVFVRVYTLAACLNRQLRAKSYKFLYTRWETLDSARRNKEKKTAAVVADMAKDSVRDSECDVNNPQSHGVLVGPCGAPSDSAHGQPDPYESPSRIVATALADPATTQQNDPPVDGDEAPLHAASTPPTTYTSLLASATEGYVCHPLMASANEADRRTQALCASSDGTPLQLGDPASTLIHDDDMSTYIDLSQQFSQKKGKWSHIFAVFKKKYPLTSMNMEAFRCRVSRASRKRKSESLSTSGTHVTHVQPQSVQPPAKKPTRSGSCESCRQRGRRCGPNGDNPHCSKRTAGTRPIANFFA